MRTVKTVSLVLLCSALLGACGLKGPLYLPDEDPPTAAQDAPSDIDGPDDTSVKKDKKKKDSF